MTKPLITSLLNVAVTFAAITVLVACSEAPTDTPKAQAPLQPVDVASVSFQPVQNWHTYTSRLESPQDVQLKPRVSGVIESIEFKEGDVVNEGDLLVKLDARQFKAHVDTLKAQIKSAEAALAQATSEAQRATRLKARNAISAEQTESRASTAQQKEAQLTALKAQLKAAQLDLEFTEIRSPINGVISRAEITKGNNVTAGQSVLTSIVSNEAMYAYFDIDERTWNQSFSDITNNTKQPVVMQLTGNDAFSHQGYIDFIDNVINENTGTLRVRAVFNNKPDSQQRALRSGAFARIKVATNKVKQLIVVPDRAIGTDLKNRFVLTVSKDNVLQYKLVELGERYGHLRAINKGLNEGDIIAVNGPARVGPGMPIAPNKVDIDYTNVAFTLEQQLSNMPRLAAKD
ncbi:efflux RND transporter periplasmic adaptor subunit [Flocculibacter collagenilyticus]|uniref:efflux RND transporter periplasmic adaptor subunit n=1 Tax=Flocculibacter collagenilyticus TaxID=2744479 RepID=UPI0018F3E35E|nr:efflux RND transporter periplasmic adaptor subunit [Flocculibacter collagenilyticus]